MVHTHSSCRDLSIAGILVADGGLGFTSADAEKYFFVKWNYLYTFLHVEGG